MSVDPIRRQESFGERARPAVAKELAPLGRHRLGVPRELLEHGLGVGRVLTIEERVFHAT
jgi:hypothetical protein